MWLIGTTSHGQCNEYMDNEKTNHIARLDVSDVHIRIGGLPLFLELDVFTAGKVCEDIQLYEPSKKGARNKRAAVYLSRYFW